MIALVNGILYNCPEHEIKYTGKTDGTANFHIRCLNTGGEFFSILWKKTGKYRECPCCGGQIERETSILIGKTKFNFK